MTCRNNWTHGHQICGTGYQYGFNLLLRLSSFSSEFAMILSFSLVTEMGQKLFYQQKMGGL